LVNTRTLVLCTVGLVLVAVPLWAQDLSTYRTFQLASPLAVVATAGGTTASQARVVHSRPALIQELMWRPGYRDSTTSQPDPVREVVFSFYDDQLYLIAVDYDRGRIEGLTDADLIDSLAVTYGSPVLQARNPYSSELSAFVRDDSVVVARWADSATSIMLVRGTYPRSLRLIVASKSLEALARTARSDALLQDEREAPQQRELERQQRAIADGRAADEKARLTNKPRFRP
jgi:hypothetical protein